MIQNPEEPLPELKTLTDAVKLLEDIRDATVRSEEPAPTLISLRPGVTLRTSTRYRVKRLLSSGAPGDLMRLTIGAAGVFDWYNISGDPFDIALPIVIDNGVDVSVGDVTQPSITQWTAYLVAYVEGGQ